MVEYHDVVKAAAEGFALEALAQDSGGEHSWRIRVDSAAANAIATRLCFRQVSHMDVKCWWAQEGPISMTEIKGNVASIGGLSTLAATWIPSCVAGAFPTPRWTAMTGARE